MISLGLVYLISQNLGVLLSFTSSHRKHLKKYEHGHILSTLYREFPAFRRAFWEFSREKYEIQLYFVNHENCLRALKETESFAKAHKQKNSDTVTSEDLLNFNMRNEFDLIRSQCPLLHNVVSGAMGVSKADLEVSHFSYNHFVYL